jgi:hypothetical protein
MKAFITLSVIAAGLLATASASVAQQPRSWCLRAGDTGNLECAFDTLRQCQAARSGNTSGTCQRNPGRSSRTQGAISTTGQGGSVAQDRARNPQSYDACVQLAIQRGYAVNDYEYRAEARNFVRGCMQGRYR